MKQSTMEYYARCPHCQRVAKVMDDDPNFPTATAEILAQWELGGFIIEHLPRSVAEINGLVFCSCQRPKGNQLPLPGFRLDP